MTLRLIVSVGCLHAETIRLSKCNRILLRCFFSEQNLSFQILFPSWFKFQNLPEWTPPYLFFFIMNVSCRGFIINSKDQSLGKLISCKDDFTDVIVPNSFASCLWKPLAPLLKMLIKPLNFCKQVSNCVNYIVQLVLAACKKVRLRLILCLNFHDFLITKYL